MLYSQIFDYKYLQICYTIMYLFTIYYELSFYEYCSLLLYRADDLSSDLCLQGIAVQSLHGDREQCDREEALQDFKEGMLQ